MEVKTEKIEINDTKKLVIQVNSWKHLVYEIETDRQIGRQVDRQVVTASVLTHTYRKRYLLTGCLNEQGLH